MGQKRPLIFLGIAMTIALVTTVMVYRWLQGRRMIESRRPGSGDGGCECSRGQCRYSLGDTTRRQSGSNDEVS